MKKLKLNLKKQTLIQLTSSEANAISGGGPTRSDNRHGHCKYSRKHPRTCTCSDGSPTGGEYVVGCTPAASN